MPPGVGYDPYRDVGEAQRRTRESVVAQGELLRPQLMQQIGDTLGGLNSIGGLRSGGTKVAMDDISRQYTDRFGQIASAATYGAIGQGLQAGQLRQGNRAMNQEDERIKSNRRSALLGAIGSVVGAGIGFAVGGPPGAIAGATVGKKTGGGGKSSGGYNPKSGYSNFDPNDPSASG